MQDLIIIGSGPAGLTAAIYAGRARFFPLVLEGAQPGGQLTITSEVENFPGFPQGVMGPEMMKLFRAQAERFGAKIISETVTGVDFSKRPLVVETSENKYKAEAVIVATGAMARKLGLVNETKLYGRGVSFCATCDGPFFKNKIVAVTGGGDTALEEANFLSRFAKQIYLIHRRDSLRASKIIQEKAFKNPKIKFLWNREVKDVLGADVGRVSGLKLKRVEDGKEETLACDGLFVAIGREPQTKIFAGQLEMDKTGYIITKDCTSLTSKKGVFAAGDCADPRYRQATVAVGTGCKASIDAQHYLEDLACQKDEAKCKKE
ncbi:MAG: thioredoxin-disulfide reductase [bacterium]|nr:thioredoxin-disulfide reductase [bacterium]